MASRPKRTAMKDMTSMANSPVQRSPRFPSRPTLLWVVVVILFVLLVAAESFTLYTVFTSKFSGGNDFFVRWLGGREYLLHGTNPFDKSVAEKAQMAMFGRLAQPGDKDEAFFAYPLYTLYFFWPLSLLPYAWAQAIWMTLLQFLLLAVVVLSIRLAGWQPPVWLLVVTILWGIFFYNGARAIILGQFSVLVGLALLLALWALDNEHDIWAGVLLSVTTIKPQMVFLIILFLLLWLLVQRRWRVIMSFGVSLLVLVASSMVLIPTWPLDFVKNAIAYSDYVAFGTPLENLLHYLLPATIAAPLTVGLSILCIVAILPGWWFALQGRTGAYTWAVMTTFIVGSLITFRSATTNQVILYLPLFFFFQRLLFRRANLVIVAIEMGLALFMWGVFVITLAGNWEHVMMHGLLPALLLILYVVDRRALWRSAEHQERSRRANAGYSL